MQIIVTGAMLKAALTHAAKQDIRYYLNGVLLEASKTETRCVATDGHRACVIRRVAENNLGAEELVSFIIPSAVISGMKIAAGNLKSDLYFETTDGVEWRITGVGVGLIFRPVEGKFPDYRRIIPATTTGELGQYNPEYLLDARKALDLLTGKKSTIIRVQYNGDGPCVVTGADANFVSVVMPHRMTDSKTKEPLYMHNTAWARDNLVAPPLKQAA